MRSVKKKPIGIASFVRSDDLVCPKTLGKCDTIEICFLVFCSKSGREKLKPVNEGTLSKEQRYELVIARQRAAARA